MTNSIKRKIIGAFLSCSVLLCAVPACFDASAESSSVTANVKTYSTRYTQTYCVSTIYPCWTGVISNKAGYEGSFKYAYYAEYGESGGVNYLIDDEYVQGTDEVLYTPYNAATDSVSDACAKRIHRTYICYTSNPASTKKNELTYTVVKY